MNDASTLAAAGHPRQFRMSVSRPAVLVMVLIAALIAAMLQTSPVAAQEDDGDTIIEHAPDLVVPLTVVESEQTPTYPDTSLNLDLGVITVSPTIPARQCTKAAGDLGLVVCFGGGKPVSDALEVFGMNDDREIFTSAEAAGALGWMVPEAEEALQALHDLPVDDRVRTYAKPEIVSYVGSRLQGIMTRYVYGQPLTDQETKALQFIRATLAEESSKVAKAAKAEYDRFQASPCAFALAVQGPPPGTPPSEVVGVPQGLQTWCHLRRSAGILLGAPTPSVDSFIAWGSYRVQAESDLRELADNAQFAEQVRAERLSAAVVGTLAASGALSATLGVLASKGAISMTLVIQTIAPYALVPNALLGGVTGVKFATVSLAAGPAALIVGSLALIAIATWMQVQREQVGPTLDRIVADTHNDGLRLDEERAEREGVPFEEDLRDFDHFLNNPPTHASPEVRDQLSVLLYQWVFLDESGQLRPEVPIWDVGEEAGPGDYRWTVDHQPRDIVSLQLPDGRGTQRLRYRDGWLLRSIDEGPWRPVTNFEYVFAPDDSARVASRAWRPVDSNPEQREGVFLSLGASPGFGSEVISTATPVLNVVMANGESGLLRLIPPEPLDSAITPSAAGNMFPGRAIFLAANPVDHQGAYRPDVYNDEELFRYEWRVFADGGEEPLEELSGFTKAFFAPQPGRYTAEVTMTRLDGQIDPIVGEVAFTVNPPQTSLDTLTLHDNGYDELQVELQASSPVPADELTVDVTWPRREGQAEPPTSTLTLECGGGPVTCETVNTSNHPVTSDPLTHELHTDTDLTEPVVVTVTNQWGESVTRRLAVESPRRFSVEPIEIADSASAQLTWSGNQSAYLQIPIETSGTTDIARLVAGQVPLPTDDSVGFVWGDGQSASSLSIVGDDYAGRLSISRDQDGEWAISYGGRLTANDIGLSEHLITVQSNTPGDDGGIVRNTFRLIVEVVPALGDKPVALLHDSADEGEGYPVTTNIHQVDKIPVLLADILGGVADDAGEGIYDGEICFWVQQSINGVSAEYCGVYADLFAGPGGEDMLPRLPLHKLFPDGVYGSQFRVETWLPDEGTARSQFLFRLTGGVSIAPSITSLDHDRDSGRVDFEIDTSASGEPIVGVECYVDDVFRDCIGGGDLAGGWLDLGDVGDDDATVTVVFYAEDGNLASREFPAHGDGGSDLDTAPRVTAHPESVVVDAGDDVTFSAGAEGTPEPTVQWQSRASEEDDWEDIAGAVALDHVLFDVVAASSGSQYRAVFTNEAGSAATEAATLTVRPEDDAGGGDDDGDGDDGDGEGPIENPDPIEPVDASDLIEDNAGDVRVPAEARAGDRITVFVGEDHAGKRVSVWIYSTPDDLGWHTVSGTGTVTVTIPDDTPAGEYRIAVYDEDGDLIGWDTITIRAAAGPDPGGEPGGDSDSEDEAATGPGPGGAGASDSGGETVTGPGPGGAGASDSRVGDLLPSAGASIGLGGLLAAFAMVVLGCALVARRRRPAGAAAAIESAPVRLALPPGRGRADGHRDE